MNKRIAITVAILSLVGAVQFQNGRPTHETSEGNKTQRGSGDAAKKRTSMAVRQTAADDLAAAFDLLDQMQDWENEDDAAHQAAACITDSDIPRTLDLLAGDQRNGASVLRIELLLRWVTSDPGAAAAWAVAQSGNYPDLLQLTAAAWAGADLESARTWVNTLPSGEDKTAATISVGYEAAREQPVVALEMMSQLAPGEGRDALLAYSVSQWASAQPEKALEWVRSLPGNELQEQLITAVAVSLADKTGEAAAALLANTVKSPTELETAAIAIIQRWAQAEPASAAAWIEQFPEGPMRREATENLITLWAPLDNRAAWEWVSQQPENQKSSAVKAYDRALLLQPTSIH